MDKKLETVDQLGLLSIRLERAYELIRKITWESAGGRARRIGTPCTDVQWERFTDYGYYGADDDTGEYVEESIMPPLDHIVKLAWEGHHED